jgi:uridylate kinase
MADKPRYKRILLKISGESMTEAGQGGVRPEALAMIVREIAPLVELGVQVGLVIGGGNFLRGRDLADNPAIKRTTADYMGMLATIMNATALRDALLAAGIPSVALSAIPVPTVCEPYTIRHADGYLCEGKVVLLAGGTGSPFFTTDSGAALRAVELDAEVFFKATKVDGVYDSDPARNPNAKKFDRITYIDAMAQRLGVMDMTAFSMCMENRLPIFVFRLDTPGNLKRAVLGQKVGTLVCD